MVYGALILLLLFVGVAIVLRLRREPLPLPVPEPKIVAAVLTAAAHKDVPLAKEIEAAMTQAVVDCLAKGVSIANDAVIRQAIQDARARVLARK